MAGLAEERARTIVEQQFRKSLSELGMIPDGSSNIDILQPQEVRNLLDTLVSSLISNLPLLLDETREVADDSNLTDKDIKSIKQQLRLFKLLGEPLSSATNLKDKLTKILQGEILTRFKRHHF